MNTKKIICCIAIFLLSATGHAADPTKTHQKGDPYGISFVNGFGAKECGEFVSDFNQGLAGWIRYYDWLQGYAAALSAGYAGRHGKAVNFLGWPAGTAQPTGESIMLWLDNYCRANPLARFAGAANAYVRTVTGIAEPEDW
ncbi:hypothetical protein PQR33_36085 [Paraburkholderia sediminicola]|uniref:hypothetical protein n=1 Tax=Paraburkholderia sediminicola TaxID=458836 RepID=UPI0038BBBB6A